MIFLLYFTACSDMHHGHSCFRIISQWYSQAWTHVVVRESETFFGIAQGHRAADKRYIEEFGATIQAAIKIQSTYRARKDHELFLRKRAVAIRHRSASKMQAVYRGRKARQAFILRQMMRANEDKAATKLQGLFRMRNARFRTMQRRHKAHEENEIKAAVLLQRRWRGTAVRNKMAIRRRKAQEYEVRVYIRKAVVVVWVNVYRELLLRTRRQHTTFPTNTCLH